MVFSLLNALQLLNVQAKTGCQFSPKHPNKFEMTTSTIVLNGMILIPFSEKKSWYLYSLTHTTYWQCGSKYRLNTCLTTRLTSCLTGGTAPVDNIPKLLLTPTGESNDCMQLAQCCNESDSAGEGNAVASLPTHFQCVATRDSISNMLLKM